MKHVGLAGKIMLAGLMLLLMPVAALAYLSPQAQFPNKTPLQPVARDIKPNISGNINHDSTKDVPAIDISVDENSPVRDLPTANGAAKTAAGGAVIWWVVLALVVAGFSGWLWVWLNKKPVVE